MCSGATRISRGTDGLQTRRWAEEVKTQRLFVLARHGNHDRGGKGLATTLLHAQFFERRRRYDL
jgi:hypothetical protein